MKNLKSFDAEAYAQYFVNEKYKPLTSKSGFSIYYVRIGEDKNNEPNSIYADTLPTSELLLENDLKALNVFVENCDAKNEFLIKVLVDWRKNKLDSKILMTPRN
jgi:hypothetical protein